jgi:hypothetical protein
MIYRLRIILDTKEDVIRDIEIKSTNTFEDLHFAIVNAFGFAGNEMASFYTCDEEWNQDLEIALFDLSDVSDAKLMSDTLVEEVMDEASPKLIYVYDFFNMWTFFVELADVTEKESGQTLPELLFSFGELPENPPEKIFEAKKEDAMDYDEEGFDDEFNDGYNGGDNYDHLDFDENWN